jgi:hypothetical protein
MKILGQNRRDAHYEVACVFHMYWSRAAQYCDEDLGSYATQKNSHNAAIPLLISSAGTLTP